MAAKGKRGERKTYSMYRLESCSIDSDPQSPETEWTPVGYFESENDASVAGRLLREIVEENVMHYAITREIREKASTPKATRKIV